MILKCAVCGLSACDCGSPKTCECGFTAFDLYRNQNGTEYVVQNNVPVVVEKSNVQVYDEYSDAVSQTGKKCSFNGAGARSECIYCGQYKYYAGRDSYQCTRPD